MRSFWILLVNIIAIGIATAGDIPEVSYEGLTNLIRSKNFEQLKDRGGKFSSFVINDIPVKNYETGVLNLFKKGPDCIRSGSNSDSVQDLKLSNGAVRTTFATESKSYPECIDLEMAVVREGFDKAEILVTNLVQKIAGRELEYFDPEHLSNIPLVQAPVKDHIHVYQEQPARDQTFDQSKDLVPKHIDNCLLYTSPSPRD